jgi:hypothetical protein
VIERIRRSAETVSALPPTAERLVELKSSIEAMKAEAIIELGAAQVSVPVVKVTAASLKRVLGCATAQKWQARAGELFNSTGRHKNWSPGRAGAAAAALKVAGARRESGIQGPVLLHASRAAIAGHRPATTKHASRAVNVATRRHTHIGAHDVRDEISIGQPKATARRRARRSDRGAGCADRLSDPRFGRDT